MRKLKYHEKKLLKKVNFLDWKTEGDIQVCRTAQKMVNMLKQMSLNDPTRMELTDELLEKLRRLSAVLVGKNMAEHQKASVTFIEQGHIRVGVETVTDPAFLVPRSMEDYFEWVDLSKIKRKVLQYNDKLDD